MKRKQKLSIFIFVLIAFIVLGVGYAAINSINLIINGTGSITATQENFLVKFLDADGHRPTITPGSPNTVSVVDNTTASFDVSTLSKKGDTVVATLDVKNESNGVGARIGLNLTNSNTTYFKVTEHIADTELQAGDITTVTITIEMIKTPIDNDETTNITATLTANPIENSSATGSDSAEVVVLEPIWTLPEGRTTATLQVGDELCLNGDTTECFYFIKYDENNKAVLLAKYNLNVGDNPKGEETFLQDSDVRGLTTGYTTYGTVAFSSSSYWMNNSPYTLKSPYNENNTIYYNNTNQPYFRYVSDDTQAYPTVYDNTYVNAPDFSTSCDNAFQNKTCWFTPGYSIAYYVEEYKNKLEGVGYGATIDDARLLLYSEVSSLTGANAISSSTSFLRKASFWLGTACNRDDLLVVPSYHANIIYTGYDFEGNFGVRPVLIISLSNI